MFLCGKDVLNMTIPFSWFIFVHGTFYHLCTKYFNCLFFIATEKMAAKVSAKWVKGYLRENGVNA